MTTELWIGIVVITVVCWGMIIWELVNSPVYPDNYINEEETEIRDVPPYEKSTPKSQTDRGTTRNVADFPPLTAPTNWEYPTSDCQCQVGVKVEKHTKDCEWKDEPNPEPLDKDQEWMMEQKHYQTLVEIRDLEKRLKELGEYSDIAVDQSAQREYLRVEKKLKLLKDDLPSA